MRASDTLLKNLVEVAREIGIKLTGEKNLIFSPKEIRDKLASNYDEQYLKAYEVEKKVMESNGYINISSHDGAIFVPDWDIFIAGVMSYVNACGPY